MVDAKAVAGLVTGLLLVLVGGLGALVVFVGTIAGAMEWTWVAWLLLLLFVGGVGLATYAGVVLAGDLLDSVSGDGLGGLTEGLKASRLTELID